MAAIRRKGTQRLKILKPACRVDGLRMAWPYDPGTILTLLPEKAAPKAVFPGVFLDQLWSIFVF